MLAEALDRAPQDRATVTNTHDVTAVLQAHRRGEDGAFERLWPLIYDELKRVARSQLSRLRPGRTLETTGLVHESYLKMVDQSKVDFQDRQHFYAVAARAMRQILIDYAKSKRRLKRGAGKQDLELDERRIAGADEIEGLLQVNEALERLAEFDARLEKVVECRLFAGYSEQETADALQIGLRTAQRDWLRARAWLKELMDE